MSYTRKIALLSNCLQLLQLHNMLLNSNTWQRESALMPTILCTIGIA